MSKPSFFVRASKSASSPIALIVALSPFATAALVNCSDDGATPSPAVHDAGGDDTKADSGARGKDAATDDDELDASTTDANTGGDAAHDSGPHADADAEADAGSPTPCFTNDDCPANRRCEALDGGTDAMCYVGPRGTGKNGVDTCTSENDCASALCVEGPDTKTFYCSATCTEEKDCTGQLPRCLGVLGICARAAN